MKNVARNVWQLGSFLPNTINCYLAEDVLIDACTRFDCKHILGQLKGSKVSTVALTHVHPDHQGAAKFICERFGAPLICHEADRAAMEGREPMGPPTQPIRFSSNLLAGPPHRVERTIAEGNEVAGFKVIEAPGHTKGHVIYFREDDRVAIVGDIATSMNLLTTVPGLHEPPAFFSVDPAENRRSIRKIHALRPKTLLFGHGPPLFDMDRFDRFVAQLPPN